MGCDIHAHIEVKIGDTWHHFAAPKVRRNYQLYAIIAGVRLENRADRDNICVISTHEGIPKDLSRVTEKCIYEEQGSGLHHFGWLTADEIAAAQDELYRMNPDVARTGMDDYDFEESIFHTYINGNSIARHDGFDDVRLVYYFDG